MLTCGRGSDRIICPVQFLNGILNNMRSADTTLRLPLSTCKDVALKIIDNLPPDEFCDVAEHIQIIARRRSFEALEQMRLSARRGGLRKRDFEQALKDVRAGKRQKQTARCS